MGNVTISQVARSTPFDATPNGLSSTNVQDAIDEVDIEIQVTNIIRVMTNPGHKDFSSVSAALASITTASSSNPYLIKIGPGVFTEPQLQMKQFVYLEGSGEQVTVLQPSNASQNFILAVENSQIKGCLITGVTGSGFASVYMSSSTASDTTGFFIEDCRFGNNDTHVIVSAVNNNNAVFISQCEIGGNYQFNNGFKATTTGTGNGRIVIRNITTNTMTSPLPNYVAYATGSGCQIWMNGCFFNTGNSGTPSTGSGIQVDSGATLRLSSITLKAFGKALYNPNTGSSDTIYAGSMIFEGNTTDIQLDNTSSIGNVIGIATLSKITNSSDVGMSIIDAATGVSSVRGFRTRLETTTTSASNLSLTGNSGMVQVFSGSTAGQTASLPDATTLRTGHRFEFWNISSVTVTINLHDGTTLLFSLSAGDSVKLVLDDNSTTNGTWLYSKNSSAGTAAMPMYFGTKSTTVANAYLSEAASSANTSDTVAPAFARACKIVGYSINITAISNGTTLTMDVREQSTLGTTLFSSSNFVAPSTSPVYAWNNSGFCTFSAGQSPAVFIRRVSGSGTMSNPRVILWYVWID